MSLIPSLWNNNDPITVFQRELNPLLSEFGRRFPSVTDIGAGIPAVDVSETKDVFEVSAELPGVEEKDVSVSLDGNRLIIAGEKRQEKEHKTKDWHVVERGYGAFHRSIALPFEPKANAIDATFDKGILHISIKKPADSSVGKTPIAIKSRTKS